jgi:hypothetical protein
MAESSRRGKDAIGSVVYLMDLMAVSEPADWKLLSGVSQKIVFKVRQNGSFAPY